MKRVRSDPEKRHLAYLIFSLQGYDGRLPLKRWRIRQAITGLSQLNFERILRPTEFSGDFENSPSFLHQVRRMWLAPLSEFDRFGARLELFRTFLQYHLGLGSFQIEEPIAPNYVQDEKKRRLIQAGLQKREIHRLLEFAVKDLLDAIENDRQPLGNIYEARGATEMIVATFESQRLGAAVKLPLENRKNPLTML